jgi:hypothetical protein
MDLDTAAEELYAGSPDDFVERRTTLAAEARAAKDRPLVKQILALRRPTRTAWLVNLLARERRRDVTALLELGGELEDAQRRRDGPALRRLSAERRQRVDRLARTAVALGAERGYPAPDAALQEVSQSLQAAMADPAVGDLLRAGRLTTAVTYGGFGPSDLMAALAASMPATAEPAPPAPASATGTEPTSGAEPEPGAAPPEPTVDAAAAERQRVHAAAVAEAEAAWEASQAELDAAESAANDATDHADELADRIEQLRVELERTEAEEASAREAARTARRRHQEARRAVTAAEQARAAVLSGPTEDG